MIALQNSKRYVVCSLLFLAIIMALVAMQLSARGAGAATTSGRVTVVTLAQDTFHRANQPMWGTASDGHVWMVDAASQKVFSIKNNAGQLSNGSGPYSAALGAQVTDGEVLVGGSMSAYHNTALGAVLRWSDNSNWYKAYINGTKLAFQMRVHGVLTELNSTPFVAKPGVEYSIRFRITGNKLYAKAWQTGTTEPANWMLTLSNASLTKGYAGVRIQIEPGANATVNSFVLTNA